MRGSVVLAVGDCERRAGRDERSSGDARENQSLRYEAPFKVVVS